jgi:hypothetical protein
MVKYTLEIKSRRDFSTPIRPTCVNLFELLVLITPIHAMQTIVEKRIQFIIIMYVAQPYRKSIFPT